MTRHSSRRKSERGVRVFDTAELSAMFECDDIGVLQAKLAAVGAHHTLSQLHGNRLIFVSTHQLK